MKHFLTPSAGPRGKAARLTPVEVADHTEKDMTAAAKANILQMEASPEPRGYGRGRPSVERVKAIDNAIIEAATPLFLRDGFDAVTMEAVANATPLSKTTLYSRFSSKELLLAAVVKNRIEKWSAASAEHDHEMPDDLPGRLRYHAMAITLSLRQPEVQGFVRLSYLLAERFPSIARTMYDEGYRYSVEFVRNDIEQIGRRDNLTVRDAKSVAQHFISAIIGWHMQESGRGGATDAESDAAADRLVELFYAARASW